MQTASAPVAFPARFTRPIVRARRGRRTHPPSRAPRCPTFLYRFCPQPFSAPTITFSTPIFHPNVDQSGNICLDILKEKWTVR